MEVKIRDKFVGYFDMGVELDNIVGLPLAHKALVFMTALTDSWNGILFDHRLKWHKMCQNVPIWYRHCVCNI